MEFKLGDILNKNLIIVWIVCLLITFGLSGCTQQFSTQKDTEDNFTVENQPPEIQHCYYSNDIDNSLRVNLLGFANDNDGEIVSYYWNLSDGFSYIEQLPSHTFQTEGTYYATLTVTDNDGATDSDTISIIVTAQSEEEEEEPEDKWNPEYGVNYEVTITNIVDGDTFDAIFPDGNEERIRLLGVDTPETTVRGNEEYEYGDITDLNCLASYGLEAKDFAETWLEGETVYIQFDSLAGFTGYYGRWLAYVFLIDGTDFNEELLNNGYARVYTEGTCSKESYYVTLQSQAIENRVGLWSCMSEEEPPEEPPIEGLIISYVHYDAAGDDRYNLNDEYVVITNNGDISIDMTGYTLWDDSGYWNPYEFPNGFTLNSGAEVTVYTGSGSDTDTELYWGRGSPIWNNDGDIAYLYDSMDNLVDSYSW